MSVSEFQGVAQAFTLTDDHDRQLAVWNAVKGGYHIRPQSIKRQLSETAHSANSALGRFVGIEAYESAGGILLRDLFDDRAAGHMEKPALLERLAIEKLQAAAKPFETDWKWVEVHHKYFEVNHADDAQPFDKWMGTCMTALRRAIG